MTMHIQSFFAPAPYGTPWTAKQIEALQFRQKNEIKPCSDEKKFKLAQKRIARLQAIKTIKNHFSSRCFTTPEARKLLNFDHVQINNLMFYMARNKMIVKTGKTGTTNGFIYQFANKKIT